jgi:hypothetical protein
MAARALTRRDHHVGSQIIPTDHAEGDRDAATATLDQAVHGRAGLTGPAAPEEACRALAAVRGLPARRVL